MFQEYKKYSYRYYVKLLQKIIKKIIYFIYPQKCVVCGITSANGVCDSCINKFNYPTKYCKKCGDITNDDLCVNCKNHNHMIDSLSYAITYNNDVFKLINSYKNKQNIYLSKNIIRLMLPVLKQLMKEHHIDIMICVPVHKKKLFYRKFSHMGYISAKLAKQVSMEYTLDTLIKYKKTNSQANLNKIHRLQNLINAFKISNKRLLLLKNKNILLIDDVVTTGSTIVECIKVLKNQGNVKEVHVLSLARVKGTLPSIFEKEINL